MSDPIIMPTKLIERAARRGLWPTAMQVRTVDDQRVATVTSWGPKHTKPEHTEEPKSRRGVMAGSGLPVTKQGALDL